MKIDGNHPNLHSVNSSATQPNNAADKRAGDSDAAHQGSRDVSQVSERAQLMARALEMAPELEDSRADRIAEVREKLAAGVYDSDDVKDSLSMLLTDLVRDVSAT